MRILMFSWRDPKHPLAGGAEQVMHEHSKGWISGGHSVTLFSSMFKDARLTEILDSVEIVRGGSQILGVQVAGFIYYMKYKDSFDLVVDQFHGLPFFTPLYSSKPKLAVIQELARQVWFLNPLPFPFNSILGFLGFILEPFIFLLYKGVPFMTGSASASTELQSVGIKSDQISIVPHGVITFKLNKLPKKEKIKTVTFLGRLSEDKGIFDALKCFSLLSKLGDYQFWVIGKPETVIIDRMIQKMASQLKIEKKLKFWGFVDQKTKFELLAKSHILVNPSIREGWGLVNIEANSVFTPVVSYNSPGLVDSVKNNFSGIIIENNTPEEMARQISLLLKDLSKYKNLSKYAKDWSVKFTWAKSRAISLELVEKIVSFNLTR